MTLNIYEYPLNERMRLFMRLEGNYAAIYPALKYDEKDSIQNALASLLEILNILDRQDVKLELIKELDRYKKLFLKIATMPSIDRAKFLIIQREINNNLQILLDYNGKLGKELKKDYFLYNLRQRTINGGVLTSQYDCPSYYYWKYCGHEMQKQHFNGWLNALKPLQDSLELILKITRDSHLFTSYTVDNGMWFCNIEAKQTCQMVRIKVPSDKPIYPEVSGGPKRVNIRFLTNSNFTEQSIRYTEPIEIEMSCCTL